MSFRATSMYVPEPVTARILAKSPAPWQAPGALRVARLDQAAHRPAYRHGEPGDGEADRNAGSSGSVARDMPLEGTYEISPVEWVRKQTEKILETGTTDS